jgi:RNA polymerase sigma-70 factor (ECF subfamily)
MMTMTEQVWNAFHTPLQQFIRRRISDEETAEDVLQDVFLKIHQHVDALKDVRKLEGWIYQITRNAIIDAYRSRRPTTPLEAEEVLDLSEELPDDDIVSELLPCVRAMVRNLPEVDRQALVLTEYQGMTQKELAERLGLSFSGAKSRVQRAREKLEQQLLECCHFELDSRNHILDYQPKCHCCETAACCAGELLMPTPCPVIPLSDRAIHMLSDSPPGDGSGGTESGKGRPNGPSKGKRSLPPLCCSSLHRFSSWR